MRSVFISDTWEYFMRATQLIYFHPDKKRPKVIACDATMFWFIRQYYACKSNIVWFWHSSSSYIVELTSNVETNKLAKHFRPVLLNVVCVTNWLTWGSSGKAYYWQLEIWEPINMHEIRSLLLFSGGRLRSIVLRASIDLAAGRLTTRSREVAKPRNLLLYWPSCSKMWQASRQRCCRGDCKISKRLSKPESLGFVISRYLVVWHPSA